MNAPILRRFVRTDTRHTHYRRCGTGSPVVLIHPGMANSAFMVPIMRRLSARFTCFAFDNPGLGNSDKLDSAEVSMADFADALAAAMRAVGLANVPVFGTHTGGAVALELAVRHPDLVSGVIVDGLPLFTAEEVRRLYEGDYAPPLLIDRLGGHFASTWTRFRDQGTFYPWYSKDPAHLLPAETGISAESIHGAVSSFFRAAENYAAPFLGAHRFGEVGVARLTALTRPAVFMVAVSDNLFSHAERFPDLRPDQLLLRLGPRAAERDSLIDDSVARFASAAAAPTAPAGFAADLDRQMIDLPGGQMLVRAAGPRDAPPLLLLHDAPGSAASLGPLMGALAMHYRVYAPDLPGSGESDALPGDAPTLQDYASAMRNLCDVLGIACCTFYGIGFGASVALATASADNSPVMSLVLRGVLLPDAAERAEMLARYAPRVTVTADGAQWYRTWLMLRDTQIYWPWYNRTRAGQRHVAADFGARRMHDWTFEVMKQGHAYHHLIEAALKHDAREALSRTRQHIVLIDDPVHPFSIYDERLRESCGDATVLDPTASSFAGP